MKYSKFEDINILLKVAESDLREIKEMYQSSLNTQEVLPELSVKIKNYLNNLKSSLDYSMKKISEYNFPIRSTKKDFDNSTSKLKDNYKRVIEKYQPFVSNDNEWIGWFNTLNNNFKHEALTPQTRSEDAKVTVSSPTNNNSITWGSGVTFGDGVSVLGVSINPNTQMPMPNNNIAIERIVWISFKFKYDSLPLDGVLVLPFLEKCFSKISNIVLEIEALSSD